MKIIDTRGTLCPQPLIMTRKAIREAFAGEELQILTDNEMACGNLNDYLTEMKLPFRCEQTPEMTVFRVEISEIKQSEPVASDICVPPASKNYVVVIKCECMGDGDVELGKLLMRAFINSLLESTQLPTAVILYNGGIHLALKDTDTARTLEKLNEKGVRIICCGTCVEYYEVKDRLAIGQVSNMYAITEMLVNAGHIIYP